jgi:hypothetical protein
MKMKKKNIYSYELIDQNNEAQISFSIKDLSFFIKTDQNQNQLVQKTVEEHNDFYLIGRNVWNIEKEDLIVRVSIKINIDELYKIYHMYENLTLALIINWQSPDSKVKGFSEPCILKKESQDASNQEIEKTIELTFHKNKYNKKIVLNFSIIVHDIKNSYDLVKGLKVGFLSQKITLSIEGNITLFPIALIEDLGGPLWTLHYNVEDIQSDPFETDMVALHLNTKHPHFKDLDLNSGKFSSLYIEVITYWFYLLLTKIKDEEIDAFKMILNHVDTGTIANHLNLFLRSLASTDEAFRLENILEDPIKRLEFLSKNILKKINTNLKNNHQNE